MSVTQETTAYTVTSDASGVVRYASASRALAHEWAQAHADADQAAQAYGATPHYVVTAWHADGTTEASHVYAQRNSQPQPMSTPVEAADLAATMALVTGSRSATVRVERRAPDGSLVVDAEATFSHVSHVTTAKLLSGVATASCTCGWSRTATGVGTGHAAYMAEAHESAMAAGAVL